MSIYAGPFFRIKMPLRSNLGVFYWVEVYGMSVPGHVGHPQDGYDYDPYGGFLPPVISDAEYEAGDVSRAVIVLVEGLNRKAGQQYQDALLTISGREWNSLSFSDVLNRIQLALEKVRNQLLDAER